MGALLKLFTKALPFVSSGVGRFFKSKDAKERSIAEWETEAMKATKGSLKDEWWTLILSMPFVFFIIAAFQLVKEIGWAGAGDWLVVKIIQLMSYDSIYGITLNAIILASFGIRARNNMKRATAAAEITKAKGSNNIQGGTVAHGSNR